MLIQVDSYLAIDIKILFASKICIYQLCIYVCTRGITYVVSSCSILDVVIG